jgi:hypothetical protein
MGRQVPNDCRIVHFANYYARKHGYRTTRNFEQFRKVHLLCSRLTSCPSRLSHHSWDGVARAMILSTYTTEWCPSASSIGMCRPVAECAPQPRPSDVLESNKHTGLPLRIALEDLSPVERKIGIHGSLRFNGLRSRDYNLSRYRWLFR